MRVSFCFFAAIIGLAAPAAATLQSDYNTAQAAFDAGQWRDARDQFIKVLARIPQSQARTRALVGSRIGIADIRLSNTTAGITRLAATVSQLTATTDRDERMAARVELALAYEIEDRQAAAASEYALVAAEPGFAAGPHNLNVRFGLIRTLRFADPVRARAEFDAALPAAMTALAKTPYGLGEFYRLRGLIELNDHQYDIARTWFLKALPLMGGMSYKVTVPGQQIRGDLSLVYHLLKKDDEARRYLAFTGAGHLPDGSFRFGSDMTLPACAPLTTLRPDDVAVIEITIGADGRVTNASTIYASRTGGPETEFAAAARTWSWRPDEIAKLTTFWRQALRLEVRCNSARDGSGLGLKLFERDLPAWLAAANVEALPSLPDAPAAARAALIAERARREAAFGPTSVQLFPVLYSLDDPRGKPEDDNHIAQMVAIAEAGRAPRDVVLALKASAALRAVPYGERRDRRIATAAVPALTKLVAAAVAEGDGATRGAAFARALLAVEREALRDYNGAEAAFREVVATPLTALSSGDPIRQVALLRLAAIAATTKRPAEAADLYRQTGLSAEQCSLVDIKPLPTRTSVGADDFPAQARAWRFEGLVTVAYDVTTDGRPVGVRAVTAMPPFVFSAGTEKTATTFRFRPTYRDTTNIGCSGNTSTVRYQIQN